MGSNRNFMERVLCHLLTITLKTLPYLKKPWDCPVRAPVFCRLSNSPSQVLLSGTDKLRRSILIPKGPGRSPVLQPSTSCPDSEGSRPAGDRGCEEAKQEAAKHRAGTAHSQPLVAALSPHSLLLSRKILHFWHQL